MGAGQAARWGANHGGFRHAPGGMMRACRSVGRPVGGGHPATAADASEVATYLSIGERHVYQLVRSGAVQAAAAAEHQEREAHLQRRARSQPSGARTDREPDKGGDAVSRSGSEVVELEELTAGLCRR